MKLDLSLYVLVDPAVARGKPLKLAAAGCRAQAVKLDVTSRNRLEDAARRLKITHLYYFATPRIFTRRRPPFDATLFRERMRVLVANCLSETIASRSAIR